MRPLPKLLFLLLIWILQCGGNLAVAEDWQSRLKTADKIRSSDPKEFSRQLSDIRAHKELLSPIEQDYFEHLQAYELIFKGDFPTALAIYEKLAKNSVNTEIKFRSQLSLINVYAIQHRWNEGLAALDNALTLLPSIKDEQLKESGLGVAGIFYNQLGQYDLGLEYSAQLANVSKDKRNQCIAAQLRFESLIMLEPSEDYRQQYQQAARTCYAAGEKVLKTVITHNYAKHLLETKAQPQAARKLLEDNFEEVKEGHYAPIIAIFQSLLATAHWQLGEAEQAFVLAQGVVNDASYANTIEAQTLALKVLYDYYLKQGDSAQALNSYVKYAAADKASLDEVTTKTLAFQLARHQSLEQQNKLKLLDQQNRLLRVQQHLARTETFNNHLLIALLFCAALGLGAWGWHSWQNQRRLRRLAEYDSLTGLLSRGHFIQVARAAVSYAQTLGTPISCIMLDVDQFKRINDTQGHAIGDWALQTVARVCRDTCREHDVIGRIGGEEICFLLPECSEDNAAQLAESLRRALAEIDTGSSGHEFNLSASFGVSSSAVSGYRLQALMQNADRAMYQAKQDGRNRVSTHQKMAQVLES
ncbi:GGDEF domain-containing protein [Shewanella sedimentimangrovi]|uniref:diguanylate cyclase n=1 Tax=Shewanella sedimentimangrovi TaxID=2814293 RepID=A0ABX7R5J2_9GAMM|nr:GGDEF domain-containing protein [Shewanella sedimentimangrovi]